jgi:hypothetical protein
MRAMTKFVSAALIGLSVVLAAAAPSQARDRDHGRFERHHVEGRRFHGHPRFVGVTPFYGPWPYPYAWYGPAYVYAPPPPPPPAVFIRVR